MLVKQKNVLLKSYTNVGAARSLRWRCCWHIAMHCLQPEAPPKLTIMCTDQNIYEPCASPYRWCGQCVALKRALCMPGVLNHHGVWVTLQQVNLLQQQDADPFNT